MQGAQLAEMEALYREEQVLRKKYFNIIEGKVTGLFFCATEQKLFAISIEV